MESTGTAVAPRSCVTIERAVRILGADRVVTVAQAAQAFKMPVPEEEPIIRCTHGDFVSAGVRNFRGKGSTFLVHLFSISLMDMRECEMHPGVARGGTWWTLGSEQWCRIPPDEGYYLVDFGPKNEGRFGSTRWNEQDDKIAGLGIGYLRADEHVVAQTVNLIYMVHGVCLMADWIHWGRHRDSQGYAIGVGRFSPLSGISIGAYNIHNSEDLERRVVISRNVSVEH